MSAFFIIWNVSTRSFHKDFCLKSETSQFFTYPLQNVMYKLVIVVQLENTLCLAKTAPSPFIKASLFFEYSVRKVLCHWFVTKVCARSFRSNKPALEAVISASVATHNQCSYSFTSLSSNKRTSSPQTKNITTNYPLIDIQQSYKFNVAHRSQRMSFWDAKWLRWSWLPNLINTNLRTATIVTCTFTEMSLKQSDIKLLHRNVFSIWH